MLVRDFLGDEVPLRSIEKIIEEADIDRDHTISYQEFLEMWNTESEERLKVAKRQVAHRRVISREPSFSSSLSSEDGAEMLESMKEGELLYDELIPNGEASGMHSDVHQSKEEQGVWI
jgi:hypothetical protein